MPDNVYKSNQLKDDDSGLTVNQLGPEEKFAGNVLKSLKEKISEARQEVQQLEETIEQKEEEARTRREEILEEARQEAESIRQEAEQEAEQLLESREQEVEEARQEGYDDGFERGKQECREQMAEHLEQAERILGEAKRDRDAFVAEYKDQIIQLAGKLAERVVRDRVPLDDEVVHRVLEAALDEVRDVREITVVLHPEDLPTIRGVRDELQEQHPSLQEIDLTEDDNLKRGGCRVHTEYGDIEATLTEQVRLLTETLIEADGPQLDDG